MYLTNNNSNKKTSYAKYKVGKMGFLHRARCTELSAQTKHKHQMVSLGDFGRYDLSVPKGM